MAKAKCPPHVWLLPTPNGHESLGRCKNCKETKMHYNSAPEKNTWQRQSLTSWENR